MPQPKEVEPLSTRVSSVDSAPVKVSQEASLAVHQDYTIVTIGLVVARKDYALVWHNPQVLGGCHRFNLMCALGKIIKHSGFEKILVETGIYASGSIDKVMVGTTIGLCVFISWP